MFSGILVVTICEALEIRPTDFQKRHNLTFGKSSTNPNLDPYVIIAVGDDYYGKFCVIFNNIRIVLSFETNYFDLKL